MKWNELNISDDHSFRSNATVNKASTAKPHPSCQKKCPYWSDPDPRLRVAQKMPPLIGVARAIRIDKKTRSWPHSAPHSAPQKGIFPLRFSLSGWLWPGPAGQGWSQGSERWWRGGGQRIRGSIQNAFKPWFLPAQHTRVAPAAQPPHTELTSSKTLDNNKTKKFPIKIVLKVISLNVFLVKIVR